MRTKLMQLSTAAALAALLATPALAQTSSGSSSPTGTHTTTTTRDTTVTRDTSSNDQGHMGSRDEVRASKLVGSTVYNEQNQSVGTLDDILMTHDQKQPVQAVISVGGFLGIGSKLVEVPYDRLKLEDGNKVVMPNASKDELKNMPNFSYAALEHNGTTNASSNENNNPNSTTNPNANANVRTGSTYGTTTGTSGTTATGAGMGTTSGAGSTTHNGTNR